MLLALGQATSRIGKEILHRMQDYLELWMAKLIDACDQGLTFETCCAREESNIEEKKN